MLRHTRAATIDTRAAKRTSDRYRFGMTLATEGDASDGDILSIRGGIVPDRMPLLAVHDSYDLSGSLGSVVEPRKDFAAEPPELTAAGEIELTGEGDAADARRDVALMIEAGHLGAVSIRWQPIDYVRRINLSSDHPAYVDAEKETNLSKRYGLFHRKWRALEGSVVPIGADQAATIDERARGWEAKGRAGVAAYLRSFRADPAPTRESSVELIVDGLRSARVLGTAPAEILEAIAEELELVRVEIGEQPTYAPALVAHALSRLTPSPALPKESKQRAATLTVNDLGALLSQHDERLAREVERMLRRATGRRI